MHRACSLYAMILNFKMNNWPNNIRIFARQTLQEWRDIAAAIADISAWIWRGLKRDGRMFARDFRSLFAKKDAKRFATNPPGWWHCKTPTAAVPPRPKAANEVELNTWTDEEIIEMSQAEYMAKVGLTGVQSYEDAIKEARRRIARKGNAKQV